MTINATIRRMTPVAGNGVNRNFVFNFKVFAASDVAFTTADADGVETDRIFGVDYIVTLNPNQDTTPGGTVTYPANLADPPLPAGHLGVVYSAVPYTQVTSLPTGGRYEAKTVENMVDRAVALLQQVLEAQGRTLSLPVTADPGINTVLPAPVDGRVIGWGGSPVGLRNIDITTFASVIAYGNARTLVANGGLANYTLAVDPGSVHNTRVAVGGVVQTPGVDYNVVGTLLTPTTPWPVGVGNVVINYGEALPVGAQAADQVSFKQTDVVSPRPLETHLREIAINAKNFATPGYVFGVDDTAVVQTAIDSLTVDGGEVTVPRGVKFNLQSLTFPKRVNLTFWMDDDLSRPNAATTLGTNELVRFMANANDDGIVNEERLTAPFHPGFGIDVRRDVSGHDSFLGPGQVRVPTNSAPARASYNIWDQQVGTWRIVYEKYGGAYSQFTGVTQHTWRSTVVLTGIGTAGWSTLPAVGTLITGSVSGAKGWFLSSDATTTTVLWLSGKFAVGDALIDDNETTSGTVSSVTFSTQLNQPLGQDFRRGNWSIGLPPGSPRHLFAVGGKVAVAKSRTSGQHIDETVNNPSYVWLGSYESDYNGFELVYNTTPAAASRRLTLRKLGESTDRANVGACAAHVIFSDAALVSTSAFNVASITKTGTGRYAIAFTTPLARADYAVIVSLEEATKSGYPLSKTVNGFTLAVSNAGTTTAVDLAAIASVVIFGGDI